VLREVPGAVKKRGLLLLLLLPPHLNAEQQ
jgi:hypothetical protein